MALTWRQYAFQVTREEGLCGAWSMPPRVPNLIEVKCIEGTESESKYYTEYARAQGVVLLLPDYDFYTLFHVLYKKH